MAVFTPRFTWSHIWMALLAFTFSVSACFVYFVALPDSMAGNDGKIPLGPNFELIPEDENEQDVSRPLTRNGGRFTKGHVFLLMLIKSAPGNLDRRNNIRRAYGSIFSEHHSSHSKYRGSTPSCTIVEGQVCCFYFVIGLSPNATLVNMTIEEAKVQNDVILGDFMDGYTELTKKLIMSLDWSVSNHDFQYLLIGDDDTFMNPSRITQWLVETNSKRLYAGPVTPYTLVIRNPSHPLWGRWYVPESVYAPANYPPYILGIAYIMSYDVVVESLLAIALKKQELFGVEDAFYGIVMDIIGVPATQMPKVVHCAVDECTESNPLIVGPLEKDLLLQYSDAYHKGQPICNTSFPTCGWAKIEKYDNFVKLNRMNKKRKESVIDQSRD